MPDTSVDPDGSSDDEDGKTKGGKSRRELPTGAVATLKAWLLSPEHFTHPYPTPQDQVLLMKQTGIDKKQLKNWFTNARRRIWKPLLKKQLEQGKLHLTGAGGGGMSVPTSLSGMVGPGVSIASNQSEAPADGSVQSIQAVQYQQQPKGYDMYGNPIYSQTQQQQANESSQHSTTQPQYYGSQQYVQQQKESTTPIASSNSIGSLAPISGGASASSPGTLGHMNKTDSHAVLNELFARDQDLVRQFNEGARLKAAAMNGDTGGETYQQGSQQIGSQHPMKMAHSSLGSFPSITSWPHFSSVSSLNNLGTLTGVKSITNMSGADLASQGNLNKKGNLAQVKSIENFGRADSYAFLEIFFDDKNGTSGNTSSSISGQRGVKRERDEDNDVGLSLEADESPLSSGIKPGELSRSNAGLCGAPTPAPLPADGKDRDGPNDTGTLKRAYDDALAARGLMAVSRSSENLTALPAKMQRTLSQEYLRHHMGSSTLTGTMFSSKNNDLKSNLQQQPTAVYQPQQGISQQYPGQHPVQQQFQMSATNVTPLSDPSMNSSSVEVPSTTKCALCNNIHVDTQLRPCGHMFHGRCLKPSLQNALGPPKCPIDNIPMQSAVLAVPTEEKSSSRSQQNTWGSSGSLPSFQPPQRLNISGAQL
uniref:Homeobox domain-containing protein n=2 Tax=Attheya septentrionalis TaxID=420275 RepID=A0A7S2UK94_9STRA|mmetsp:Transcript_28826/g.52727  ORF Transcript_28826/g.52727 Transcript_28826/m.52727 type:complete len:648 (+) Transcript_28826:420-2363(+)